MIQESSKAIVLRSLFFKDNQKIVTLFSERFGIISLLMKGVSHPPKNSLSEPFCEAEYFFSKGTSDLRKYQDASILDLHLHLRSRLPYLKTASSMVKALLSTQLPEKASPALYLVFASFLKQIPLFPCQEPLLSCFYLKFLKHEGLYHESEPLPGANKEENALLSKLVCLQSFEALRREKIPLSLASRVESFFLQRAKH